MQRPWKPKGWAPAPKLTAPHDLQPPRLELLLLSNSELQGLRKFDIALKESKQWGRGPAASGASGRKARGV